MTPDRWQQIEQIYHQALDRTRKQRSAFLNEACDGDQTLRREVESLLAYDERARDFIAAPPDEIAAEMLAADQTTSLIGNNLDHYKIIRCLGQGGMGEVYLATDTQLGRKVAIKLLPKQFTAHPDRVQRFKQEARAASGLNHPNILTIYEIGEVDQWHFIVSEFIEGQTLREQMSRGRIELRAALDIATQIALALEAAHQAGIVHRDIKPENVMVRPDGLVKVLDFGLAKLTELPAAPPEPGFDAQAQSVARLNTEPGMVMGTVSYMSPEQARGQQVDHRTDIFSFGVMFYELLAGRRPFVGTSANDLIAALLTSEPKPLSELQPEAPPELERAVSKCLAKKLEDRYQTSRELQADLKKLEQVTRFIPPIRTPIFRLLAAYVALVAFVVAGFYIWRSNSSSAAGTATPIKSIAVLPFKSLGPNSHNEYLELGMADTLITKLSNFKQIIVRPTSAVRRYAAVDQDPVSAGEELKVDSVLDGSLQQRGDRVRITVRLVRTSDGQPLWSLQCDEQCSDVFTLQDIISTKVADAITSELTGEERKLLAKRYTANTEAYQFYLKGRYYWNQRTEKSLKKGIEYFKQAIDKDPNYALAFAGLADCYVLLNSYGGLQLEEFHLRAKAAAEQALALDKTLAEAHTTKAYVKFNYDWDWAGTELEYQHA